MHITSISLGAIIITFTLLVNVLLAYFNLPGQLACTLINASPETQDAAAALIGR